MKIQISLSGGRSSAMMLYLLLQKIPKSEMVITFANTGREDEKTLEFVRDIGVNWGVNIIWIEGTYEKWHYKRVNKKRVGTTNKQRDCIGFKVVTFETAARAGEPFTEMIDALKMIPNRVSRNCTSYLKIVPMQKYLQSIGMKKGGYDTYMGIRYDEPARWVKYKGTDFILPLVDARITDHEKKLFWAKQPFDLQIQDWAGNCYGCPLKSITKFRKSILKNPEKTKWMIEQESKGYGTFRHNLPTKEIIKAVKSRSKWIYAEPVQYSLLIEDNTTRKQVSDYPKIAKDWDLLGIPRGSFVSVSELFKTEKIKAKSGDISCFCGD